MQYELYPDVLLLTDMTMNLMILFLSGKVLKLPIRTWRILCAAFAGAVLHIAVLIWRLMEGEQISGIVSLVVMVIMIPMAFSVKDGVSFVKILAALLGVSAMISGFMQAANPLQRKTATSFVLAAAAAYVLLMMLFAFYRKVRRTQGNLYSVELFLGEDTYTFKGLLDTGNRLWDPVYQKPVHVLEQNAINKSRLDSLHFHLIPYHSIGRSQGLLPAVIIPRMVIRTETEEHEVKGAVVAISKERVSAGGRYQMILHEEGIG